MEKRHLTLHESMTICVNMQLLMRKWHSQILGSFEAKNITCVVLHENLNLAIEITKDVFPDVKKCKKVRKSGLKRLFCIFQPYGRGEFDQFSPPMCATRRVFQPCG